MEMDNAMSFISSMLTEKPDYGYEKRSPVTILPMFADMRRRGSKQRGDAVNALRSGRAERSALELDLFPVSIFVSGYRYLRIVRAFATGLRLNRDTAARYAKRFA